MSKHTPGPWSYDFIPMKNEWVITRICPGDDKPFRPPFTDSFARLEPPYDCEANARLIAAAPELLEALKKTKEHLDKCEITGEGDPCQALDWIVRAIAKAEGRE